MVKVIEIAMMVVAGVVCVLVVIQDSAIDNNLISAFSNSRLSLFSNSKERGSAKIMMIVTYVFVCVFMLLAVAVMIINRKAG